MMNGLFVGGAARSLARANQAQSASERAVGDAAQARAITQALELDIEKLFMITEALWSILKEHHGYADEHLAKMLQMIDMRSGKLDGRGARQPNPACPQCNRTIIGRHSVCLYCGGAVKRDPFTR